MKRALSTVTEPGVQSPIPLERSAAGSDGQADEVVEDPDRPADGTDRRRDAPLEEARRKRAPRAKKARRLGRNPTTPSFKPAKRTRPPKMAPVETEIPSPS
jgi:hypothetical protein